MTALSLTMMQFNIEYGGTGVDFEAVPRAIEVAGADIVAVQEGCGQMPAIAAALGWRYFDNRTQVVSRYPLLDPPVAGAGVVFVEPEPGRVVAVINVHPTSRMFGPTRVAKGERVDQVIRGECRTRLIELLPSVRAAEMLMQQGIPVILLGDFNAPSHRDWGDDAVGTRPHLTASVPWPTSIVCEDAGLVDVYRRHFPDAVAYAGITWPAARPFVPGYNPHLHSLSSDRIDLMFVSRDVASSDVRIMGEAGSEFSDLSVDPWPTDHRALVAELIVEPVEPPALVSVSRRLVPLGDFVELRVVASGAVRVRAVPTGASGVPYDWELSDSGRVVTLDTADLEVGRFELSAHDAAGAMLAQTRLWVAEPDAVPTLQTDASSYRCGEPIEVRWRGAPANRADFVAVFRRGDVPAEARQLTLAYTGATVEGVTVLDAAMRPGMWPLLPGEYTAHLLRDDRPVTLASADFTVTP